MSPDLTSILSKQHKPWESFNIKIKSPNSSPSCLGVIKQSIRDFRKTLQTLSLRASTQKVCDAKWVIYSSWCHRKKVNPVMASLTVISLYTFFFEGKCQISIIKVYRSMISSMLKFKSGNRISSNPLLSELIYLLNCNVQYKDLLPRNGIFLGS